MIKIEKEKDITVSLGAWTKLWITILLLFVLKVIGVDISTAPEVLVGLLILTVLKFLLGG